MPTLALNYTFSGLHSVLIKEDGSLERHDFPYSYSNLLFSHYTSQQEYYEEALKCLKKAYVISMDIDTIATGFPQVTDMEPAHKLTKELSALFKPINDYDLYYLDKWTILTQNEHYCCKPNKLVTKDNKEIDYISNLVSLQTIEPQTYEELKIFYREMEQILSGIHKPVSSSESSTNSRPVLFSGPMMKNLKEDAVMDLTLLFLLNCVQAPGLYKISVDQESLLPLGLLAKNHGLTFETWGFMDLGTIINSPGMTTCLVTTNVGTTQLIEVEANTVFILPIDKGEDVKILVKGAKVGTVETTISGGTIGIILDTREKVGQQLDLNDERYLLTIKEARTKL